jgi:succinate dehydrogenase / fumarate reductase cytochrome b subunit
VATTTKPYSSSVAQPAAPRSLTLAGARRSYFNSSVGTKVLVGTTGLLLFLYLVLHIAGNLLVFFGPATFNGYSYFLISNPLIVPVEIGLLAVFLLHVYKTVTNWWANRHARPQNYYRASRRLFGWGWARGTSRKSIASSTMIFSGIILFLFLLIHLRQFRFGAEYTVTDASGREMRDLYRLEMENFSSLLNVTFYALCMVVVGSHIWHGFSSAFNSVGVDHPRYTRWVLRAGRVLAVLIAGGFLLIPIWAYAFGGSHG